MEEFRASENYRNFERAVAKGQGKVKGKAGGKAKAKLRTKAKKKREPKPESMPQKPLGAAKLFARDPSVTVNDSAKKAWAELGAEGQKRYEEQAAAARTAYDEEMANWLKSAQGKAYQKAKDATKNRAKVVKASAKAKEKFLRCEGAPEKPEKPKAAQALFDESKRAELREKDPNAT